MATDEGSLECDLAETYHILDMRELPARRVALFACGLRDSSRIKQKLAGVRFDANTLINAAMLDRLSLLVWAKTKDAVHGRNVPKSMVEALVNQSETKSDDSDFRAFASPEAFERCRRAILSKGG